MRKITIAQIKEALTVTVMETKLRQYRYLLNNIHQVDVSINEEFQKVYCDFFQLRIEKKFHAGYFGYMNKHKRNEKLSFEKVLRQIYDMTERVEASFASKLLSMVNPEMPVLDSHVLKKLCIEPIRYSADKEKRIQRSIVAYTAICMWYADNTESDEVKKWINLFNKHYPEDKDRITDVKKIDLILWRLGAQILDEKKRAKKNK